MKVIYDKFLSKKRFKSAVVAIGVFDSLHQGHRRLVREVVRKAKAIGGTSIVMTFFPHPLHILRPRKKVPLVVSLSHRLRLIQEMGVDVCVVVKFTREFSSLSPQKFMEKYFYKMIKPKEIVVGYDFRFGKNRAGDARFLEEQGLAHGIRVHVISAVKKKDVVISTTKIRRLIKKGKLQEAQGLLGRPVSILGTVRKGAGRGKRLGYPTANVIPSDKIFPPNGVYLVEVAINTRKFRGMANVGTRPSFTEEDPCKLIEVHIFNFSKNIYEKEIEIIFLKKIRDEKKFSSKEKLIGQIKKDEVKIRKML